MCRYCGKSMRKTHRSILNAMHVILHTGVQGQRSGVKATVEVHLGTNTASLRYKHCITQVKTTSLR